MHIHFSYYRIGQVFIIQTDVIYAVKISPSPHKNLKHLKLEQKNTKLCTLTFTQLSVY